jgi:hypothetical protein
VGATSDLGTGRPRISHAIASRRGNRAGWVLGLLDLAIVVWLIWIFDVINNLAPVRQALAVRDGEKVLSLEHTLHLAPEHALNTWLAGRATLGQAVVFWYEVIHITVTIAVFAWLWWRRPDLMAVMRATLVIATLIALAVFWSFPVAPPRMLPGGYLDLVAVAGHVPVWQLGATALDSNQLCSMPSLHIAWATWCSVAVWQMTERRWLRAIAVIYPFVTSYAVMATGNHYLADALAGATITLVVFAAVNRLRRNGRFWARAQPSVGRLTPWV